MKPLSKQSLFSLQTLILLSALVVVDAGSAVQPQPTRAQALTAVSAETQAIKSHNPQCAVWATCNGQRQAVRFEKRKALLLAVAMGLGKNS